MTPKTPDYGHRQADRELTALLRRLRASYRQASLNLQEKISAYMERFEQEDTKMRALYDSGEMSHEDYMSWRYRKLAGTKQWQNMRDQLTNDLVNADKTAASMINGTLPGVYAENHNYGTYEAERGSGVDTTYTLYDKDTVARLMNGNPDLLPAPSVDIPKDMQWNRQHLQSALLQGILTGESMRDIAKRFQQVAAMDERAAMRNARTAVTGAQNAGRIDSYLRAQKMGIGMKQVWMSTKDGRTRDSHAMMDGEKVEPGKKFSNGCRYPGDPHGHPAEIYNCRCTVSAEVEGSDPYDGAAMPSNYLKEQGLSYAQWKRMHAERFYNRLFSGKNTAINRTEFTRIQNISGAKITDNYSKKADEFAEMFYNEIRLMKSDVSQIASNIGEDPKVIQKIKDYLFMDKSYYDEDTGRYEQFAPDCAIAQSWQRLFIGKNIKPHDLTLINHEKLEMELKQKYPNLSHSEAHAQAKARYNYEDEADAYYGSLKKHRKG